MYRNVEVRRYCEDSLIYFDTTLFPNRELASTLNSFREIYNGLYKWSDTKLLNKLNEKWKNVDEIQENHVEKLFNENNIKKEEIIGQGIQPISAELSDHSLLDMEKYTKKCSHPETSQIINCLSIRRKFCK